MPLLEEFSNNYLAFRYPNMASNSIAISGIIVGILKFNNGSFVITVRKIYIRTSTPRIYARRIFFAVSIAAFLQNSNISPMINKAGASP